MATTVPTQLPVQCLLRLILYFQTQWLLFVVVIICVIRGSIYLRVPLFLWQAYGY